MRGEAMTDAEAIEWIEWFVKRISAGRSRGSLRTREALRIVLALARAQAAAQEAPTTNSGAVRVCPDRDAVCPYGMECPYAVDRYECRQPQGANPATPPSGPDLGGDDD
jgi:hypothetical protein